MNMALIASRQQWLVAAVGFLENSAIFLQAKIWATPKSYPILVVLEC